MPSGGSWSATRIAWSDSVSGCSGDREEALDAAQEVFLKTYGRAGSLEPKGELFTWMYRVATNHCLNRIRRRKLAQFLSLTPDPEGEGANLDPVG